MVFSKLQRARRKVLNRIIPFKCMLGDATNNPYAPEEGYYWVRRYDRADANGNTTPGTPFRVRSGSAIIVPRGGRQVWVGTGLDGHLTVLGFVHEDLVSANVKIDPRLVQPNDPYRNWIRLKDIQNFRALPIGTGNTPSMKVQVRQLFYYTETGDLVRWNGTNADTHIDLTDVVPAAGLQRYAVLWLRTYNPNNLDDVQVTVSTPIDSVDLDLSFDDLQECADNADADAIPIQAFRLADAQTALKLDDTVDVDLRQFINMPQVYGFPNDVARQYRIHENHSVVMPEVVTLSTGGGIQIQAGGVLVILDIEPDEDDETPVGMTDFDITADAGSAITVTDGDTVNVTGEEGIETETSGFDVIVRGRKFNYPVSDIPNANDDDTQGYVPFSLWINQATGRMYYCEEAGTGTAVWYELITSELVGQELDTKVLINPIIDFIFDPNGDVAVYVQGDGNAANADSVAIGTFTDIPRIYVNTFSTNRNLEIMAAGTGNIVSGSTVRSDTDNTDDLGTTAVKWRNMLAFLATFEERSTPTTPATGDAGIYAKASGSGGALFSIDDAGTDLQLSPQIAIIADSQTSGTNAGATTTTTWVTRPIQTEVSDPHALVTLSANKFTPVAGVYDAEVFATVIANASAATLAAHRLFNVTSTTELAKSANVRLVADTGATASFRTRITANGTDEFRVDTYVTSGRATTGLGQAVSTGSNEIYTIIVLRKIG